MKGQKSVEIAFLALSAVGFLWGWVEVRWAVPDAHPWGAPLVAGAIAAAIGLLAWALVSRWVLAPMRRVTRGMRAVVESLNPDADAAHVAAPLLGDLP